MKMSFVAFVLLGALATTSVAEEKSRTDNVPKFAVGDRWVFSQADIANNTEPFTYANEVKEANDEIAWLYGKNSRGEFWWKYDVKRALFIERRQFDPEAPDKRGKVTFTRDEKNDIRVQFPLEVGKRYSVTDYWSGGVGHGDRQYKVTVAAYEKVKTAAGEFDAYRIASNGFWNDQANRSSGSYDVEEWYSPAAKRIVKSVERVYRQGQAIYYIVIELVEFKVSP